MDSRCLLALLVMACSSSQSAKRTNVDGASKNDTPDSGFTGDNSQCPVWPPEKLFPTVGPFFYGPDPGPCTATQMDRAAGATPKTTVVNYTYDGDHPTMAHTPTGATLVHQYEYTYSQGLLTKEVDFKEGLQSQITYTYDSNKATYLLLDATGSTYEYDYNLDDNGYPKSMDVWSFVNGKQTALSSGPTRFVFQYDNCRIQRRDAFTLAGDRYDSSVAAYSYDDAGHLTDINSPDREVVYDYACWAPTDAGTDSAQH